MSDLGLLLKKARTERGLSLDELQETTKIRKRYLEAIEEGNYKILPGNFYVRAFIKTYAEAVGLEPEEVLRLYRNVIPSADAEQTIEPIRRVRATSRNWDRIGKWTSSILLWSFLLLIVGIIYYFISITHEESSDHLVGQNERLTNQTPSPESAKPEEAKSGTQSSGNGASPQPVATNPPQDKTEANSEVVFAEQKGQTYIYKVSKAEIAQIELKVTGDRCWLWVKHGNANGAEIEQKEYKNGEIATWKSPDGLWIRLGKPLAVEMKVNGSPIPVPETVQVINIQVDLVKA
ncbi:helix-turn-helix domain-containing protein [Paenibacillus sp. y28]|uniref:helix-turn-helix domain-containing protein n=1 Tax=Paenibacillus sp. y28 TaxID=3129110 RepID=UPI003017889B